MTERTFDLRLTCVYAEPDNTVTELAVEHYENGAWRPFELGTRTPGFLVFVYAIFTCQHLYLRTNCAERGLILQSAIGSIHLVTTEDWEAMSLRVDFEGRLRQGAASTEAIRYVIERMGQCPVSKNLADIADSRIELRLV